MVLPECHDLFDRDGYAWECARSLSFGMVCLFTLVIGAYGCRQILPIFLNTHWYITNLVMLSLTEFQMALLVYECFIENSTKILVLAKYCRGLQVAVSCMLYGKLACDMLNRSTLYYRLLAPVVIATTILMTIEVVVVVIVEEEIDCHNLSWLMMSTAGVVLAASFALPGRIVLDEIKTTSRLQQKFLSSSSKAVTELDQSHHQLWILLICNLISMSFQLIVDIYVTYNVVGTKTCNSMFFEDGSGPFEQTLRLLISSVSYLLPNWAIIYVFYLLPRFQFSTSLDLPELGDDDSYQLLMSRDTETS